MQNVAPLASKGPLLVLCYWRISSWTTCLCFKSKADFFDMALALAQVANVSNVGRTSISSRSGDYWSCRPAVLNCSRVTSKLVPHERTLQAAQRIRLGRASFKSAQKLRFPDGVTHTSLTPQQLPKLIVQCRKADHGNQQRYDANSWQECLTAVRQVVGKTVIGSAAVLALLLMPVGQADAVTPRADVLAAKTALVSSCAQ